MNQKIPIKTKKVWFYEDSDNENSDHQNIKNEIFKVSDIKSNQEFSDN